MDLLTITLMLMAALLHAGWHSLVKAGGDQTVTLAGMGLVASVAALATLPFVPLPPQPCCGDGALLCGNPPWWRPKKPPQMRAS